MVIQSASPLTLADGKPGVLVGGTLLNGNLVFIDTINDLVYRNASLPEGSQGTATLFLDDVRISTNVRLFEGKRALGTRVSHVVRGAVLGEGNAGGLHHRRHQEIRIARSGSAHGVPIGRKESVAADTRRRP
jgi:hypothetical protein